MLSDKTSETCSKKIFRIGKDIFHELVNILDPLILEPKLL